MKPNPLINVISYPPEAWQAISVLNFDGDGWQEVHQIIQGGFKIPESIIELKHASDVLAAIQQGDEVAMLRSLVDMINAITVNERIELTTQRHLITEQAVEINFTKPILEKGYKAIDAGRNAAIATHGTKAEREVRYKKMLEDCLAVAKAHPRLSLKAIRQKVARKYDCKWTTIRDHTTQLKKRLK